ncbi:MAG: FeoB-associated Cys-rich membrane protein [Oscillospiraceae bacterium]|nr:FeoB-associated Cys-rich membrane protein [Oscillospiraceae bacterium]
MGFSNLIVLAVIGAILALAGWYIYSSKKKGKKCIGCPHSGTCGSCSCGE